MVKVEPTISVAGTASGSGRNGKERIPRCRHRHRLRLARHAYILRPTRAISSRGSSRESRCVSVGVVECGLNEAVAGAAPKAFARWLHQ